MLGSGMNLVSTVIGFGMSATFIVFVCARLICGRIRSTNSRASAFDLELRSDLDTREHTINGLEPVVVAAFPTIKYNKEAFHSKEDAQCTICLGEYQEKDLLRIMPTCGHDFHLTCIDLWLRKQSTCPICRLPLRDFVEVKLAPSILQVVDSPEVADDSSYQWLLPIHEQSEGSGNNHEIHESMPANLVNTQVQPPEARI